MPEISNETFTEQQPAGIVKKEEITEKRNLINLLERLRFH